MGILQIPGSNCVEKPKETAETLIQVSRAKIKELLHMPGPRCSLDAAIKRKGSD